MAFVHSHLGIQCLYVAADDVVSGKAKLLATIPALQGQDIEWGDPTGAQTARGLRLKPNQIKEWERGTHITVHSVLDPFGGK